MINFAYIIMTYILIVQAALFIFLALPTPKRIKGKIVRAVLGSKIMSKLLWIHLGLCIIAVMFYAQLQQSQKLFTQQKQLMKVKGLGHAGSQVRVSYLSYQIQRIQRNKYITFMVVYATIALNVYLRLLYHIYEKRGDYSQSPSKIASNPANIVQSPVIKRDSLSSQARYSTSTGEDKKQK